jgi:hypothetical protein
MKERAVPMADAPMPAADGEAIRARLAAAADSVRHPALGLGRFTAGLDELAGEDEDEDGCADDPDAEEHVAEAEREPARLRRAALLVAALEVVDECIDDLQVIVFGEDGLPDPDDVEESFAYRWFPRRHRGGYDERFFRRVMVTAVKVAADLADPRGGPASCTAEEIIRHAVGVLALDLCEKAGLGRPWLDPDELLLEDADFEFLYDTGMDGLEDDPAAQAALGIDVPPAAEWFTPFNPDRLVHPYAKTPCSSPVLHDLLRRLGGEDLRDVILDPGVVDAAAPLASFAAGSQVVALARQAAIPGPGVWVADDRDRERSFAALVAAASGGGSGWLDWEPHEGADAVRAEPVISLTPRRHFPAGDDQPWVHAAIGTGHTLAIPLRFVVSYRPDPQVRQRWTESFSSLPG